MYLDIKNLSKKYDENFVLENLNLRLMEGEIISIVGTSGSGKTTLLNCISGICNFDIGEIFINSKPVHLLEPNKRNIGFVFQESTLLPHLNVLDNITLNLKNIEKKELSYLLEKIQISKLIERYPHELSGGEVQRVSVARSLIRRPDLLLLDEPFTNLDSISKKKTKELILNLINKTNTTTIIVSHDINEALEISDKILVLDSDKKYMFDTPQKVYNNPKSLEIAEMFGEVNRFKLKNNEFYCRPQNVLIVEKSEIKAKVIKSIFLGLFFKIELDLMYDSIIIYNSKALIKDTIVYLKVEVNNCLKFN
tara:strand:- start:3280 stop:4203 length:924 start_codon:yes stop_codon:yes gene_type:complete